MRIRFMELVDTVARSTTSGIGYAWRVLGDGALAAKREATAYSIPGIFFRPGDADEEADGTEDCAVLEDGDERTIIGTRNATAWQKLLAYLGREFDRGELVFSRSDGTARCTIHVRPNGDVIVKGDDGGSNNCTVTWDASTGNIDMNTSGTVNLGGTTYKLVRWEKLEAYMNTAITGLIALLNGHGHVETGGTTLGPSAVTPIVYFTNIPSDTASTTPRGD